MKTQQAQVQPQALWQALSPRQQQQLLALLEKWTLRCWKNHPPVKSNAVPPTGGRHEHQQQQSTA